MHNSNALQRNLKQDKWFVGGSPYYVASSWIGYQTQQKMPPSNTGLAAKLWRDVMKEIHKNLPAKDYPVSSYVVKRYYCAQTGLLATDACEKIDIGWYKKTGLPGACTEHDGELLEAPKVDEMPGEGDGETPEEGANGEEGLTTPDAALPNENEDGGATVENTEG